VSLLAVGCLLIAIGYLLLAVSQKNNLQAVLPSGYGVIYQNSQNFDSGVSCRNSTPRSYEVGELVGDEGEDEGDNNLRFLIQEFPQETPRSGFGVMR
jgi:hypothetical protein